jgi:leucyl-tRNA synthetase
MSDTKIKEYNFSEIEPKWRKIWEDTKAHKTELDSEKPKYYCLDMFPYPSGSGLHVGHWMGYVISDVWSRYKKMHGFNLLHPMGWDAFGLPAENYAIKHGIHPRIAVQESIDTFRRQLKEISAMYDWDREINTTDPGYYKWTQWIFLKMYEKGLAYRKNMPINWCPSCKVGLANEEAAGGVCDRCGTPVTKKDLEQWMLKITAYAGRLIDDLDQLNWPEKVKTMQTEWIGRSEGAEVDFVAKDNSGNDVPIRIFTTRPDTMYGATYMVLAPEHPLVGSLTTTDKKAEVDAYIEKTSHVSDLDRMAGTKGKSGVFLGSYALNPLTNKAIPVWISDYVLIHYGTGAIMAVPGHDERDFEFAGEFKLPIIQVISPNGETIEKLKEAYTGKGVLVNSEEFNNVDTETAKKGIISKLAQNGAKSTINFKLRDWVFSRQRYWGEPIPIIHCPTDGEVPMREEDLPLLLPDVEKYEPSGTGESPLANIPEFVNTTCPKCGGPAKRETNTMPQWAGSSWYFLRYVEPHNDQAAFTPELANKWLPVDMYIGGIEHAVLHLLYARFFTKVLFDLGYINFNEPFKNLFNQGMVCKNGAKMSKNKGNVVSPDEVVTNYGTDSLRAYEMFMGPPDQDNEWDDRGITGVFNFIKKAWRVVQKNKDINTEASQDLVRNKHQFIQKITQRIESVKFNTVVSGLMEYTNFLTQQVKVDKSSLETLVLLMAPVTPHISEELWHELGHQESIFTVSWPTFDEELAKDDKIEMPVQINGKLRGTVMAERDALQETVQALAMENPNVTKFLEEKTVVKIIHVPNKIFNMIIK